MSIRKFSTASISAGTNKSTKLWDQETFQSGMFALATVSLASSQSSITFSDIPSEYSHLQIRTIYKNVTTGAADYDAMRIQYNGDTGSSYSWHYVKGEGTGSGGVNQASSSAYMWSGAVMRSGTGQTSMFSANVIDIYDYANTSKNKTQKWYSGTEYNGTYPFSALGTGTWYSTSAVTSIKLYCDTNASFAQYSTFALYGIKAA